MTLLLNMTERQKEKGRVVNNYYLIVTKPKSIYCLHKKLLFFPFSLFIFFFLELEVLG